MGRNDRYSRHSLSLSVAGLKPRNGGKGMNGFRPKTAYTCVYRREYDGLETEHDVIHCCPGDWHDIKERLVDGALWTTLRMGPHLVAIGPPRGLATDAFRHFVRRCGGGRHVMDHVAAAGDGADAV